MAGVHEPVLREEVLSLLDPKPGEIFIDATVNGGGHARAIMTRTAPGGVMLGIDWDCDLIKELGIKNTTLVCDNYVHIRKIAEENGIGAVDGVLFDLGFSSHHVDRSGRGFSFMKDEPLDMRYNLAENDLTAATIVNTWPQDKIADILWRYGEERFARRIASVIVRTREKKKIISTAALVAIIARSIPRQAPRRIHPATRAFQALRIAVNRELESLERVLPDAGALLAPGGRLAVISFHSLEDRIVKTFMREQKKKGVLRIATARPIRPTREEMHANPRARSARLRGAIKNSTL